MKIIFHISAQPNYVNDFLIRKAIAAPAHSPKRVNILWSQFKLVRWTKIIWNWSSIQVVRHAWISWLIIRQKGLVSE